MMHSAMCAVVLCLAPFIKAAAAVSSSSYSLLQDELQAAVQATSAGSTQEQLLNQHNFIAASEAWHGARQHLKESLQNTQHGQLLQDSRPYVIAHRGASGLLPEHTLPAYLTAIAQGADFIECDVVVTKDLQLICRHEPNLNTTTNAWSVFQDRAKTYTIDGEQITGIFASDLTLDEVKQLTAKQRWPFRDHTHDGAFAVATLSEFLDTALSATRPVGIYPEVKHPTWHNSLPHMKAAGTSIEQLVVHQLHARGYAASTPVGSLAWRAQPIFIQNFEPTSLKRLSQLTPIPLVLLMGGWPGYVSPDMGLSHAEIVSDAFLADLATYAAGVGPWKSSLYTIADSSAGSQSKTSEAAPCKSLLCSNFIHPDVGQSVVASDNASTGLSSEDNVKVQLQLQSTGLVEKLHSYGFQVHPYTLRDEAQFVIEGCGGDVTCEFAWLFDKEQIDGGFADYPGTLHDWLLNRDSSAVTSNV